MANHEPVLASYFIEFGRIDELFLVTQLRLVCSRRDFQIANLSHSANPHPKVRRNEDTVSCFAQIK